MSFLVFVPYLIALNSYQDMPEREQRRAKVIITAEAITIVAFFTSIALIPTLKGQMGWDVYRMIGADASDISIF